MISAIPVVFALLLQAPSPAPQVVDNQKSTSSKSLPRNALAKEYGDHEQSSKQTSGASTAEWITAGATLVYALAALLTLLAIYRQSIYIKRGLKISIRQTRIALRAANAAKQSAVAAELASNLAKQSAEAGQLPDLELVDIYLNDLPIRKESCVYFQVKNHAKGNAVKIRVRGWLTAATPGKNIDEPELTDCGTIDKIRGRGATEIPVGPVGVCLDFKSSQEVFAMQAVLAAKIEITYSDIFGTHYNPISAVGILHGNANAGHFKRIG